MEALMTVVLVLLITGAAFFGVDSRPVDADRPTRWWPSTPRD
jgi:hypothetical protein